MDFLRYTLMRLVLLLLSMVALYAAGMRGIMLFATAFILSGIISFFLLRKQREAMNQRLLDRTEQRIRAKTGLQGATTPQESATTQSPHGAPTSTQGNAEPPRTTDS